MSKVIALAAGIALFSVVVRGQVGVNTAATPEEMARQLQTLMAQQAAAAQAQQAVVLERAAFLGVSTSPVPAALREQLRMPKGFGLLVDHVDQASPAEIAGIKQYDVLQKLDDQSLINAQQMATLVRSHKAGDEIKLTVIHQGQTIVMPVKLVEKQLRPLDDASPWIVPPKLLVETNQDVPLGDFVKTYNSAADGSSEKRMQFVVHGDNPFNDLAQQIQRKLANGPLLAEIVIESGQGAMVIVKDGKSGNAIFQIPADNEDLRKVLPPEVLRNLQTLLNSSATDSPATTPNPSRGAEPTPATRPDGAAQRGSRF